MLWRITKPAAICVVAITLTLVAGLGAGCGATINLRMDNEPIAAPLGSISVYQLAGRLDMTVEHCQSTSARLVDASNTIMLFADPGSQIYVNGKPIADNVQVVAVGGMLFVPAELSEPIAKLLVEIPDVPAPADIPPPPEPTASRVLVVLDPGHGGKDPGTTQFRIHEKRINLTIALKTAELLRRAGHEVVLTRTDDTFIELNERAAIANRAGAALFVSIHGNSSPNKSIEGFTVFVARTPSAKSISAAKSIARKMTKTGVKSRGIKHNNLRVLVKTVCPAVLVELGFLSNRFEAVKLADDAYQDALAAALAEGLVQYLASAK